MRYHAGMFREGKHIATLLIAACTAAILAASAPAQDAPAEEKQKPPTLPKPIRTDPVAMPALAPAIIDDTLAIGGTDIDAKKVLSRMTVAVTVNGRGPYRFVVDSGADSSVIGTRLARQLALPIGQSVTLNGMTGTSIVPQVLVERLDLGPTGASDLELPVLEERDLGGDGMLGIDALADERLMMDFEKRLITVEDATKPAPRWDGEIVVTARRRRGQLILTQVKTNGQNVDAVVDTGSEITIGNFALRDALKGRKIKMEKIEIIGVTGVPMELELIRVGEIRLGSVMLRNVPIAFADVPPFEVFGLHKQPSLLLGTDLMETFRRVSLDFRHRKVRFQLRKCKETGVILSTVGSGTRISTRLGTTDSNGAVCKR